MSKEDDDENGGPGDLLLGFIVGVGVAAAAVTAGAAAILARRGRARVAPPASPAKPTPNEAREERTGDESGDVPRIGVLN